jgi:hypothetical protein
VAGCLVGAGSRARTVQDSGHLTGVVLVKFALSPRKNAWGICLLLGLLGMAWGVVAPLFFFYELKQDAETGSRVEHFDSLLMCGPLGRHLAQIYARNRFHNWRGYGFYYVRTPGVILPGSSSDEVAAVLGPPDLHAADHDIWWRNRDMVGRQMLAPVEPGDNSLRARQWNEHIVAEYDERGRLQRLFVPDTRFNGDAKVPDAERSPPPLEPAPP